MPLTDTAIKALKPQDKPYKISDSNGLYLLINKTGKYFRFDYKFGGKRKTLAFGVYPETSLKEARQKIIEAKENLKNGIDPSQTKKQSKNIIKNDFGSIAGEWLEMQKKVWKQSHTETVIQRLTSYVLPTLADKEISEISAPEILNLLRQIEKRGIIETAHRTKTIISQVFRYAIATNKAESDPTINLKGALQPVNGNHFATITDPLKVGELLRAIDGYQGSFVVKCALQLAALTFVRPGELRHAEWIEFDIEKALWKIPADKMKMKRIHIVPLSKQAVKILNDIKGLTGSGRYVFPSIRTTVRPISENTINAALRRFGYEKSEMTGHGFRAMASTLLYENGFESHLIEMQLAHAERNSVKASYNHAQYLGQRKAMLDWWGNYLDSLKAIFSVIH